MEPVASTRGAAFAPPFFYAMPAARASGEPGSSRSRDAHAKSFDSHGKVFYVSCFNPPGGLFVQPGREIGVFARRVSDGG